MPTTDELQDRVREVAQTLARVMIDVEMFRKDIKTLKDRVAVLENRAGVASQLPVSAQTPVVLPGPTPSTHTPPTFNAQGYQVFPDDPLRAFMAGESTVSRAIAKHKFDITVGNRTVTPLDHDYGAAYNMAGRFAGVSRELQAAWLLAILQDGGAGNPPPPWYLAEFGNP